MEEIRRDIGMYHTDTHIKYSGEDINAQLSDTTNTVFTLQTTGVPNGARINISSPGYNGVRISQNDISPTTTTPLKVTQGGSAVLIFNASIGKWVVSNNNLAPDGQVNI